ncbi:hypothetical protein [Paenibacillus favisporus]|uniref:hypothetical protein n=1 Tax=Paenibacillus favisporus TaxID=221028 RepID=UPI0013D35030|nr:hypothetical protein [Paenibacillus favisporus]
MKFNLYDNGINSLITGIDFYDKYLNSDDLFNESGFRNLKLAVICIHNSVEILIKYLLSKQNDLLIYNDLSNKSLLEVLSLHNEMKAKTPLHNIVNSRDIYIKTITYNEAISRFKVFYSIKEIDMLTLELINNFRNKITHFGIYREIDFYEVIGAVNNTIEFIVSTLYPIFSVDKCEYYDVYDVCNKASEILEFGRYQEHEYWSAFYSFEFEYLDDIITKYTTDTETRDFLYQRDLSITRERDIGYQDIVSLIVFGNTEDFFMKIYSVNYPGLNITLLKDDNEMVIACLDHYYNLTHEGNKKIYESKKPFNITDDELNFKSLVNQKKFIERDYDFKTVKSLLTRKINEAYSGSRNIS